MKIAKKERIYESLFSFFMVFILGTVFYLFNVTEEQPQNIQQETNTKIETPQTQEKKNNINNIEHDIVNDIRKTNEEMDLVSASYLAHHIVSSAKENNVDPLLLTSVIKAESRYCQETVSDMGAVGLGQLTDDCITHLEATYGKQIDVYDSFSNVDGTSLYLSYLQDYFNGDIQKVIGGYNAGPNVSIEEYPLETKEYLRKVNSYYESFQNNS